MMLRRGVTAALGLGLAVSASGADWDYMPFGSIGGYYESNLGLSPLAGLNECCQEQVAEQEVKRCFHNWFLISMGWLRS